MGVSLSPRFKKRNLVEFSTVQIKQLKQLIESLKGSFPDIQFNFSRRGITISQTDIPQACVVKVILEADNFEHYYISPEVAGDTDDSYFEICLSSIHLFKIFKSVTSDDSILEFWHCKDTPEKVTFVFKNSKKGEDREFELSRNNSVDDVMVSFDLPDPDDCFISTIPAADLQRICKDLKNVECDTLRIEHDGTSLVFVSSDDNKSQVKGRVVRRPVHEQESVAFQNAPSDCVYQDSFKFSYIAEIAKSHAGGSSESNKLVKIILKSGIPLIMSFQIGTLGELSVAFSPKATAPKMSD